MIATICKIRKLHPEYSTMTVTVKTVITNELKIRLAIALFLVRLAGRVAGFGVEVVK